MIDRNATANEAIWDTFHKSRPYELMVFLRDGSYFRPWGRFRDPLVAFSVVYLDLVPIPGFPKPTKDVLSFRIVDHLGEGLVDPTVFREDLLARDFENQSADDLNFRITAHNRIQNEKHYPPWIRTMSEKYKKLIEEEISRRKTT